MSDAVAQATRGRIVSQTLWAAGLLLAFAALVFWFNVVDFYDRHFFSHGLVVLADNLARIGFIFILSWLIYAPGAAVASLLLTPDYRNELSPLERCVLAFGVGLGLWHVLMLLLGLAGLYYRSVMIGLATIVLLASARHFGVIADSTGRHLVDCVRDLRRGVGIPAALSVLFVVVCAILLLLVRGLYPGGGGDYYTHYFYYYLEVLKNHDLSPNDVWYHYYYSKGYGLFFLGMLLTDPEAPALATFVCVIFAALAMAALARHIAPGTLWPACVAGLFLLSNVITDARGRSTGGGHFQKDHEQIGALIVLVAVALCMARGPIGRRVWVTMAASTSVAIAIIAQPIGVIVGFFFMLVAAWSLLRRRWAAMWTFGSAGAIVGGTVAAIMVLGYFATGLAHDQALDLTLRFADVERLDRWGVLPQLVIVAWIRDNYQTEAVPWSWMITSTLPTFLRFGLMWPYLLGPALLLGLAVLSRYRRVAAAPTDASATAATAGVAWLGAMIAVLAVISVIAGRPQPVSFERASTFFIPLWLLFGMAVAAWAASRLPERQRRLLGALVPIAVLIGTMVHWNATDRWFERAAKAAGSGLHFFAGSFSLADAYAHQDAGLPFGGINPQALAAWRQVEPGARIWATNVDGYCAVPGCWIESVVSFKTSGKLDQIVSGSPEEAKRLLQEAGLNYFLISANSRLLDLLPYSKLFAPDTIGRFLGIKWTDGSMFLLTWIGPDTTPLTPKFFEVYRTLLDRPEMPWFRFSRLVNEHIAPATAALRAKRWGTPVEFAWRVPPVEGKIHVVEATSGENCRNFTPKFPDFNFVERGNATSPMRDECEGKSRCEVHWEMNKMAIGNPAAGCLQDFVVEYRCGSNQPVKTIKLPADANGKTVSLECPTP